MRLAPRTGPRAVVGVAVLVLASSLVPLAGAHNPGATLYHPVQVEDRRLVVGGEGTYAYLDGEGQVLDRGNISLQGEVLAAPATAGGQAAVVVRSIPDLVPHVQVFVAEGPAWRAQIGEPEAFGYVVSDGEGFTAFSTEGHQTSFGPGGEVRAEHDLPRAPEARPAPADEGWWVPMADGLARVVEGEIVDRRDYTGMPTDVTVDGERVLVSLSHPDRGRSTLMVYDASLELIWSRGLQGLRLGGQPAVVEDRIVVGTYGQSARLVALDAADGSIAWQRPVANATAVAPAAVGGDLVAATNDGLQAYAPDGTPRWQHAASPYLESPSRVGEAISVSSSENRVDVLHPNGTLAWSFSDGIELPAWSHHGEEAGASSDGDAGDPQPVEVPGPSAALVALASLLALAGRCLRRP